MTGRKYEKPLYLEMDFDEALERFATVDPDELPDNIKLRRKKKGGTKPPKGGNRSRDDKSTP